MLAPQAHRTSRTAGLLRLAVLAALLVQSFPDAYTTIGTGLDQSWVWQVNASGGIEHGFGPSLAFTYGPLAFLLHPMPMGDHFLLAAIVRFLLQGAFAAAAIGLARGARLWQVAAATLLYALAISAGLGVDFHLTATAIFAALVGLQRRSPLVLCLVAIALGPVVYMKASLEISAAATLTIAALIWWRERRSWRAPALWLGLHAASLIATGRLLFGSFASLRGWQRAVIEITDGYSAVMSVNTPSHVHWGILLVLLWLLGTLWLLLRGRDSGTLAALASGALFLAFKQGFVREDGHVMMLYTFIPALLAGLLLASRARDELRMVGAMAALALLLCAFGIHDGGAFDSAGLRRGLEGALGRDGLVRSLRPEAAARQFAPAADAAMRSDRLPSGTMRALHQAGGRTTVIPSELTYCPANGLDCEPFPTLQAYSAYTTYLDEMSAAHFAAPGGPRSLLVDRVEDVDSRNLVAEMPRLWQTLLADYSLASSSSAPLVLTRRAAKPAPALTSLGEPTVIHGGDSVAVPTSGDLLFAHLSLQLTLRGRLAKTLLRIPTVWLDLHRRSGSEERLRIVPATAAGGVLMNQLPGSLGDLAMLLSGQEIDPVDRFSLAGPGLAYFREEIGLRWSRMPRPLPGMQGSAPPDGAPLATKPMLLNLDVPAGARPVSLGPAGVLQLRGWALDIYRSQLGGIYIEVDGRRRFPLLYGTLRPDVAQALSAQEGLFSGFEGAISASSLGAGVHELVLHAWANDASRDYVWPAKLSVTVSERSP